MICFKQFLSVFNYFNKQFKKMIIKNEIKNNTKNVLKKKKKNGSYVNRNQRYMWGPILFYKYKNNQLNNFTDGQTKPIVRYLTK